MKVYIWLLLIDLYLKGQICSNVHGIFAVGSPHRLIYVPHIVEDGNMNDKLPVAPDGIGAVLGQP